MTSRTLTVQASIRSGIRTSTVLLMKGIILTKAQRRKVNSYAKVVTIKVVTIKVLQLKF